MEKKMTQQEIKTITDSCFLSHQEEIQAANKDQLKKVKFIISTRVTAPIALLLALGFWMLKTTFDVGSKAAAHQAATTEKVDIMGRTIMEETKARREGDDEIKSKLDNLERKLDENLLYLYQNSIFKERGGQLPFKIK